MRNWIVFFFAVCLTGCDPTDKRLKIKNRTSGEIFYSIAKGDSFVKNPLYILDNDTIWASSNMVLPNSYFNHALIGQSEWEYFINRDCEDSTLRVFFFTKELITKYKWDSIVHYQIYSGKKRMTVDDLEKKNWEVIYAP